MALKYKVGDRVKIKSLDWYKENRDDINEVECGGSVFVPAMITHCGYIRTISEVFEIQEVYHILEDNGFFTWTDEMIEGLVESIDCKKCGLTRMSTKCLFMDNCPHNQPKNTIEIPEGWVLKDEHGNVINTTKIVLEKKKEYPKTYEGCEKILGLEDTIIEGCLGYEYKLLNAFQKLLMCRDAYWKIAGEEMGLGKPWEPDYDYSSPPKYTINCYFGDIIKEKYCGQYNRLLSFPTEEMRDAFYDNFKVEIESCKEFL